MRTVDLNEERQRRRRQACRQLATDARHACLAATPDQALQLKRLIDGVRDGSVDPVDARAAVNALRAQQRAAA